MFLKFYNYYKFDTITLSFNFFLHIFLCLPFQSCPLLAFIGTKQSTLFHLSKEGYLTWNY